MPMIDAYASAGTFADKHKLAVDLASTLMRIEQVPDIPMFRKNTAAFVHDLPPDSLSNVDGDSTYVRVQVLTNFGALDRDKQLKVVRQFTDIIAAAAGDPGLAERTWVLLTEAPDGGWGLAGHANTNAELIAAARAQIAELAAAKTASGPANCRPAQECVDVTSELGVMLEQEPVGCVGVDLDAGLWNQAREQVRIVRQDHRIGIAVRDEHRHVDSSHSLQ